VSIIEGQKVNGLFNLSKNIIEIISNNDKWLIDVLLFFFNLLKLIGYEIDFSKNLSSKYFNLETLQFENFLSSKSVKFPHNLLKKKEKIDYENSISFFKIFETILQNYHLNNMNLIMPNNYLNFKQLILNFLRK
jgi:recombinational DNA repair protein (RecF pathway)